MASQLSRRSLLAGAAIAPAAFVLPRCGSDELAAPDASRQTASPQSGNGGSVGEQLRALERSYRGRIGAFGIDTGRGATVAHRSNERFPLLSTFKVLAASAVLRKAREVDPGLMQRVIHYTEDDLVPHSPVTEKHVDAGLPVAEICAAAITRSDNTAGNLLLRQIGGPKGLTQFARGLGDSVTRLDRREIELNRWHPGEKRDTTSPERVGRDLQSLAHGDALHPRDRTQLDGWLRDNITGDERIRAGLPSNWTVGDKTGAAAGYYAAANDIAIARPPKGTPIVLAIYTNRESKDAEPKDTVIAHTASLLARALGKID